MDRYSRWKKWMVVWVSERNSERIPVRGWCAVYSRRRKWVTAATTVATVNRGGNAFACIVAR